MSMDNSGTALAKLIVASLPVPAGISPAEIAVMQASNLAFWTTVCQQFIIYIQSNATISTTAPVVSSVVAPSGGGPCTGTLVSNGTIS